MLHPSLLQQHFLQDKIYIALLLTGIIEQTVNH